MTEFDELDAFDVYIGRRIRALRLERNISQFSLGLHIGLSAQQIQKIEKGRSDLSASRLYIIANLFDVHVQYFVDGFDPDSRSLRL